MLDDEQEQREAPRGEAVARRRARRALKRGREPARGRRRAAREARARADGAPAQRRGGRRQLPEAHRVARRRGEERPDRDRAAARAAAGARRERDPVRLGQRRAQARGTRGDRQGRAQSIKGVADREVRVEGHTDDVPIRRREVRVELGSVGRARRDGREGPRGGRRRRRSSSRACGYGEYRPLAPNDSAESRARNRRIEIALVAPPAPATE